MIGLGSIYIDSDHFFNLSTPSTILGANFKIKSLSIFFPSLMLVSKNKFLTKKIGPSDDQQKGCRLKDRQVQKIIINK